MLAAKTNKQEICKLQLYTLGRFEIYQKDKGFYSISARATKLWYLFKYLLLNKGKGIPPETILKHLYPDEEYENPRNTLQNIVYRLRKVLSQDEFFNSCSCNILYNNGCYSLYFNDDVFLDTDIFEGYIQKADSLININPNEATLWYENALKLYQGDYFPELIYEDWVIPKRNYYRRLYTQSVLKLVKLYQQKKEFDKSIKTCEQAIQIEPYEEGLHIALIENLMNMGRIKEAIDNYNTYTSMLYKQFGIKPTAELLQVYKMLKNSAELNSSETTENQLINENTAGAFYCDRKLFNSIFILERRRSERTGHIVFVVSISVNESTSVFNSFRKSLIKSLRKGDVVTTWDSNVLLVLLPRMDYKQIITIMDRIINQFKKNAVDYDIKVKVNTALPTSAFQKQE